MNNELPLTPKQAKKLLKKLDARWAAVDTRIAHRQQQRQAILEMRAICAPYMRENPELTIGQVLALLRQSGHGKPN